MPRLYFALDLRNDPVLIQEYERWHEANSIWPAVTGSLRDSGVQELELYRCGNRLVQVLEASQDHAYATGRTAAADANMLAWEELMWRYQQALPFAQKGEKWVRMHRLFSLRETLAIANPGGQSNGS
jgi:L-rhamnose mutarotase